MRFDKVLLSGMVAVALALLPMTPASAQEWHYRHHGCWFVGCVVGAVVGTAAAVVTLPFAIATGTAAPPPYYGPGYQEPPPPADNETPRG